MSRKYLIETHGCQMNVHDSERMAGLLEQAGYERTSDDRDADVAASQRRATLQPAARNWVSTHC